MSPRARCGSSAREVYIIPALIARAGHQNMHIQSFAGPAYDMQLALEGRRNMTKSMIMLHVCNYRHTFRHRVSPYLFTHALDLELWGSHGESHP